MANEIQMLVWTLLIGGMLMIVEILLMGPIAGPMFALSTFCGVAFVIMLILLPNPIDEMIRL